MLIIISLRYFWNHIILEENNFVFFSGKIAKAVDWSYRAGDVISVTTFVKNLGVIDDLSFIKESTLHIYVVEIQCLSAPCLNDGSCQATGVSEAFICTCQPGIRLVN